MASAKKINIMSNDIHGNNPMHYACLANNSEVMAFFHQQLRGMLTPEIRLVDSVNNAGETPLLRAMSTGQMTVIKALLDEKSNPLVRDNNGNNVLINCAKNCQFWCLNYMYDYIKNNHGTEQLINLLHARDINGWGCLEWAIESGELNTVEYLIKKGLNPHHIVQKTNENALHIAISNHRIDIASYLLDIGCDFTVKDQYGLTPLQNPALGDDSELKNTILNHERVKKCFCCLQPKPNITNQKNSPTTSSDLETGLEIIPTYKELKDGTKRSYAIKRTSPTRLLYLLIYAFTTTGLWLLSMVVPFYAYIPLVALGGGGYSYLAMQVGTLQSRAMHAKGRMLLSWWQQILGAPEKYIGFWLGNILAYLYFYLSVIVYTYYNDNNEDDNVSNNDDHSAYQSHSRNPTHIAGLNCLKKDPSLFCATLVFLFITFIAWLMIVWIFPDPGIVDTRERDFFEVMEQSLHEGGVPPNASTYCRTTLVKKPLRSKFCASSGYVVARMDHYCVWLNSAVGYGNHRTFIVFLYSHYITIILCFANLIRILIRDTSSYSPSYVTGELISQRMLFITCMTIFSMIIICGLTLLVVEQTVNIFNNMTTNEKVNRSRYSWLKGPNGEFRNRFDRGPIINILEFLGCSCYQVDYMKIMNLNEIDKRNNSALNGRTNSESTTIVSTELIAHTGTRVGNPIYQQQQQQQSHHSHDHSHDHAHNHNHNH